MGTVDLHNLGLIAGESWRQPIERVREQASGEDLGCILSKFGDLASGIQHQLVSMFLPMLVTNPTAKSTMIESASCIATELARIVLGQTRSA